MMKFQETDMSIHVAEILDKWESCRPKDESPKTVSDAEMDKRLSKLLESQALATTTRREYTDEEKKIREAILSQYSQLSDNEVNLIFHKILFRSYLCVVKLLQIFKNNFEIHFGLGILGNTLRVSSDACAHSIDIIGQTWKVPFCK